MAYPTDQELQDAKTDIDNLEAFANDTGTVTLRSPATTIKTMRELVTEFEGEVSSAQAWASETDAPIITSPSNEYSSKEYAQGAQTGTGGSAKNWAQETGGAVTGASANSRSAKAWAQEDLSGALLGGSAKNWASRTSSEVDGSEWSAKAYAQSDLTGAAGGSAKDWAQGTGGTIDGSEYSAKSYAQEDLTGAIGGSSKDWAQTSGSTVDGAEYSAKAYAQDDLTGAAGGSAKDWAATDEDAEVAGGFFSARHYAAKAQASLDAFESIYLGAQASDPSVDGNGDPVTSGDWYYNTTSGRVRIYTGSIWDDAVEGGTIDGENNWTNTNTFSDVDINGGAIDATPIGGSTPAAGTFTTLGADDDVTFGGNLHFNSEDLGIRRFGSELHVYSGGAAVAEFESDRIRLHPRIAFSDGSADAPSISFAPDSDTGIYRAGTNKIGFATGGYLRGIVNSIGEWGINTNDPQATFDVNGTFTANSIDATPIGGSTPAAGTFTNVTASGDVDFSSSTNRPEMSDDVGVPRVSVGLYSDGGSGVDATSAFTGAISHANSTGQGIYIPAGTWEIDPITLTSVVDIYAHPDAIIKLRSFAPGDRWLLNFSTGASGSTVRGGQWDGNRDAHASSFTGVGIEQWQWAAFYRTTGAAQITVDDVQIQNWIQWGLYVLGGAEFTFQNSRIVNSDKLYLFQGCDETKVSGIKAFGIGNQDRAIFQHATEVRRCDNSYFENIVIKNFNPSGGLEPIPTAFVYEGCRSTLVEGNIADGYTGSSPSGRDFGLYIAGANRCIFRANRAEGYYYPGYFSGLTSCHFDGFAADGQYRANEVGADVAAGVVFKGDGMQEEGLWTQSATASTDWRSVYTGRGVVLRGLDIKRCYHGIINEGSNVTFEGVVRGSNWHGVLQRRQDSVFGFPEYPGSDPKDVRYKLVCSYNRGSGYRIDAGDCLIEGVCNNNGINGSSSNDRSGVQIGDQSSGRIMLRNLQALDDQSSSYIGNVSFEPGTEADEEYDIVVSNPDRFSVGQDITIEDGGGTGTDITGTIIRERMGVLTLSVADGTTFSATGNTTSIGNVSVAADALQTVTGSGFNTAGIEGPTWVQVDSEWRLIVQVVSDTELAVSQPFTGAKTSQAAVILQCDSSVSEGQPHVLHVDGSYGGEVGIFGVDQSFAQLSQKYLFNGNYTAVMPGSEYTVETGQINVTGGFDGSTFYDKTLVSSLPYNLQILDYRFKVTENLTGLGAGAAIAFRAGDADETLGNMASGLAITAGTEARGPAFDASSSLPIWFTDTSTSANAIGIRITGGAGDDNAPSGGKVRAEIRVRQSGYNAFP